MQKIIIIFIFMCLPGFASADQVRFTGRTTADRTLISDTIRNVLFVGKARLNCSELGLVEAEVLPKDYVPPKGPGQEGKAPTIYERWTATFCGQKVPLLIAFWPASDGGMMFRVEYPYPKADIVP